jgi:hydrogenase nickel incorporation protein HypA/HybF
MHELGIAQEIVSIVSQRCGGRPVRRIVLEVGKLSAVLPDALRFCFDLATEGTAAHGASLEIVEIDGLGRCRACGASVRLTQPYGRCACGGSDLEWEQGDELTIREMEVH